MIKQLISNFHLADSTLLVYVSVLALCPGVPCLMLNTCLDIPGHPWIDGSTCLCKTQKYQLENGTFSVTQVVQWFSLSGLILTEPSENKAEAFTFNTALNCAYHVLYANFALG